MFLELLLSCSSVFYSVTNSGFSGFMYFVGAGEV